MPFSVAITTQRESDAQMVEISMELVMEMWHFCLFPSDVLMNTELFIVMNVTDCRLLRSRDVIFIFVILASHFSQLYHKKGPD